MDTYSSGEDLVLKARKPYTITKQRERWTEEEHNRFLEALKLYGRAWQRIEEHIGTKTAVQIRSHAQKFFTKLEKEAIIKGVPIGQSLNIEIPPPRPKRKPNNPYPRKTSVGTPASQMGGKDGKISSSPVSSSCHSKVTVAMEKEPEKPCDDEIFGNSKEYHDKDNCSEAFTPLTTAPCESASPAYKITSVSDAPKRSFSFRQYVPLSREAMNQDETTASQVTTEANGFQMEKSDNEQPFQENLAFKISNVVDPYLLQEKSVHTKRTDELKQSENDDTLRTADVQASQKYPRHVPVHILDGSLGMRAFNISPDMSYADSIFHQMGGVHGHQKLFMNPAASAASEHYSDASKSSVHQSFPSYHPGFAPIQSQDDYQSFLHVSTAFSSLIVSALSQNPAAYAAASFAATLWPSVNTETSVEPSTASAGAFQSKPISTTPSMAAIAAATVAAATAWWAAHGLLPLCAPYHPGFACSPASGSATPMASSQGGVVNSERRESSPDPAIRGQQLEPECSEALHEQHLVSKVPRSSSSDSEESEGVKLNVGLAASETAKVEVTTDEQHDADKSKNKKLADRSSCGSNTPSSSEVEADALETQIKGKEEKHTKEREEPEELDAMHAVGDPFSRRCRSTSNNATVSDSWKEVSEEGRLAFDALFSREVLPQSFSPPPDTANKGKKNCNKESEKDLNGLQLDLNENTWVSCSQEKGEEDTTTSLIGENKEEEALNTGLGIGYGKLKARRTGFKPYKRCSMEAKECRVSGNSHDEEKCPKRLRVEGEAST
ncbi:hypothetical protein C2S52_018291 [Perilla frutescens var. hirtella]|nr:hypothetical protein C2S52_018291 [Perilla frutescens var. hirtella]